MTKLEEEMFKSILDADITDCGEPVIVEAKAAAEVAKRYIEKAYDEAFNEGKKSHYYISPEQSWVRLDNRKHDWLKENGIV